MKYYPIGTIVTLQGGNRPIMIYGRKQIQATTGKMWDYVACLYPEGNLGEDYNIFFQQDEIDQIHYMGCISPEEHKMQELLNQVQ